MLHDLAALLGPAPYSGGGMGLEETSAEYVERLLGVVAEVKRVLKSSGSFWLNIGDAYRHKSLAGIPWRVALAMTDRQGWLLRNSVIWNKVKGGPDNATDKLRNVHENVFHFVKSDRCHYDADAIRRKPGRAKVVNGAVVSATGVSGVRYRRQIELSTALTDAEKQAAFRTLDAMLGEMRLGKLSDFRMIIRGQQRATHSDSERVSGRAANWPSAASTSSSTTPTAPSPATCGTSSPKTPKSASCTSPPTRKTCAACPSWRPARRGAWCSTPSPAPERRTGWRFAWEGSRSESMSPPNTSASRRTGAGCCYDEAYSDHPVAELYGLPTFQPADWKAVAAAQQCPFLRRKCLKNRKSRPELTIGTCGWYTAVSRSR